MPEIVFIMGKSSSGKDRIFKQLKKDNQLNLKTIVTYTTRPMRKNEKQGEEYIFVNRQFMQKMKEKNKIIESRTYKTLCGEWDYFTVDDGQIDINNGKYIIIGTLQVYKKFIEYFGEDHLFPIYVEVDDAIRIIRAVERERKQENPRYDEICRRFLADCEDFSEDKIQEVGIGKRYLNNGNLEDCIYDIKKDLIVYL